MFTPIVDQPVARHQPPGPPHEFPAMRASRLLRRFDALEELQADWLWRMASAEGRRRLLIEHGFVAA